MIPHQLSSNIEKIFEIKEKIHTNKYYDHFNINNNYNISPNTISIVMTSSNRSKQTYYTLDSFKNSIHKNIHVIIVDDSTTDPVQVNTLVTYPFYIDFIRIKRDKKEWINPCVNYNIGFLFVKGEKIIIQNAEVFHVGDVLDYVNKNVVEGQYLAFDVRCSKNFHTNDLIYMKNKHSIDIYDDSQLFIEEWYQSAKGLPYGDRQLHFLTAIHANTFKKVKSFSFDYAFGVDYDDDDFLFRIKIANICTLSISNETSKCGGIHLYHSISHDSWAKNISSNDSLHSIKKKYFESFKKYIELSDSKEAYNKATIQLGIKKPVVVTITGIRPDFIRMSMIFKELDNNFHHILIHTGQHYDTLLSDVFFQELNLRTPDYILNSGKESSNHYEQLSYLSSSIPSLLKENNISPDLILFLGDSNSASVSLPLKKEGYKIGHIEAGMRSYDKRMLEELNRTVCDHCSDILFVYHEDYKQQLAKENITKNVFVVGNTIVEPFMLFRDSIIKSTKLNNMILLDIHRPENFNYVTRLIYIFKFANKCIEKYKIPVKMLYFKRLHDMIQNNSLDIGKIEMVPLMSFKEYLSTVYNSRFIISDSGTGQEEPALLNTPVVVPRDFSERPQSYENNCSIKFAVEDDNSEEVFQWIHDIESGTKKIDTNWLGDGQTSKHVTKHLQEYFLSSN
jgi:UDP-N-acetylglucosamine 2-epimerase (non-hydrolysing)